ncbi:cobalt-precorrin-7 (C(5))-methyltransferase [Methanosarcinales archaeon]|nr:MAG: cobalt-precorrin-7 (C(5))-methyltransferase [Methanosarcinales archaeon]
MKIVGVGIGPMQLTREAIRTIESAAVIYGSKRAIELAQDHIHVKANIIKDYSGIPFLPDETVVLSTGDPMLSGLGKYKKAGDIVIPGISSMQIACARLGIVEETVEIVTVHGRDYTTEQNRIIEAIEQGRTLFLLPDPKTFGTVELASLLTRHDIKATMAVCEKLTYPDEQIRITDTRHPPTVSTNLYCIVVWR